MATIKKTITINKEIAENLEKISKELNTTQKEIIENAINFYLNMKEKYFNKQDIAFGMWKDKNIDIDEYVRKTRKGRVFE